MKGKEYFYSPLDGMPMHGRVTPSITFAGTHLEVGGEPHSASLRIQTARSGDEQTNHEANAPTSLVLIVNENVLFFRNQSSPSLNFSTDTYHLCKGYFSALEERA